jgi:uncharacterized metal-binding protein YceD (DUF177 family)
LAIWNNSLILQPQKVYVVDRLLEYKIPYKGLPEGIHKYNFELDGKFFEAVESEELSKGKIKVKLEIDKQSRMMILDFVLKGSVIVDCDRCADEVELKLKDEKRIIVKYHNDGSDSDEIIILNEKESFLNVSLMMYEFIVLALPMRRVHSAGKCNPEQLKMLENLNIPAVSDSKWEALKNIKFEDN